MTSFTTITKMTGRPAIASCLSGVRSLLPASGMPSALLGDGAFGRISERPTQAPAAEAAQATRYALAANGAGLRQQWVDGGFTAKEADVTGNATTVATQHHSTKRAFRGLEPWRDPA